MWPTEVSLVHVERACDKYSRDVNTSVTIDADQARKIIAFLTDAFQSADTANLQSSPPESSRIDTGDMISCAWTWTGELSKVGYVDGDWLVLCDFWRRVRLFECKLHTKAAPEDRRALLMQMAKMVPVNGHAMYARGRIDHEDRDLQSNLTEAAVASLRSRADTRSADVPAPEPENVAALDSDDKEISFRQCEANASAARPWRSMIRIESGESCRYDANYIIFRAVVAAWKPDHHVSFRIPTFNPVVAVVSQELLTKGVSRIFAKANIGARSKDEFFIDVSTLELPNLTEHPDHWDGDPFCHVDMLEIKE